jgi:hypothetical protein
MDLSEEAQGLTLVRRGEKSQNRHGYRDFGLRDFRGLDGERSGHSIVIIPK